jgi:hypothetical protein
MEMDVGCVLEMREGGRKEREKEEEGGRNKVGHHSLVPK